MSNGQKTESRLLVQTQVSSSTLGDTKMTPKKHDRLWFNKDAQDAARSMPRPFRNSKVTAVHEAPSDIRAGTKATC